MGNSGTNEACTGNERIRKQLARNGIEMVLRDRIRQINQNGNVNLLWNTLDHIHFEYRKGFSVSILMDGQVLIGDTFYSPMDYVIFVRESGFTLFVIYMEKDTNLFAMESLISATENAVEGRSPDFEERSLE